MVYMKFPARRRSTTAMTLPEVLVALLLLGLFLPSVFAVNGVCLRLINATKESTAALQSVHDRCETLRNLAFTDLVSASQVQSLMATPANASDFCKNATEVVKISAYPSGKRGNSIYPFAKWVSHHQFYRDEPWQHSCASHRLKLMERDVRWARAF